MKIVLLFKMLTLATGLLALLHVNSRPVEAGGVFAAMFILCLLTFIVSAGVWIIHDSYTSIRERWFVRSVEQCHAEQVQEQSQKSQSERVQAPSTSTLH